jgi:hypothetical protein
MIFQGMPMSVFQANSAMVENIFVGSENAVREPAVALKKSVTRARPGKGRPPAKASLRLRLQLHRGGPGEMARRPEIIGLWTRGGFGKARAEVHRMIAYSSLSCGAAVAIAQAKTNKQTTQTMTRPMMMMTTSNIPFP